MKQDLYEEVDEFIRRSEKAYYTYQRMLKEAEYGLPRKRIMERSFEHGRITSSNPNR